jgi:hypothetical protein
MKSLSKILSLLTVSTVMVSCNEKISPELQSGNASSSTTTVASSPDSYYFKVTNNSAAVLNYVLHRTGDRSGLPSAENCKIESTSLSLNNIAYVDDTSSGSAHADKLYDISCFFEAEELALFFNGLSFKVEASKNTCDYISYAPYSFFNAIPGSSNGSFLGITCDDLTTQAIANPIATGLGATWTDPSDSTVKAISCGTMVDISLPLSVRRPVVIPADFNTMCKFDYDTNGGGNGENCDIGSHGVTIRNITTTETDTGLVTTYDDEQKVESCGGAIAACVGGPIKQISKLTDVTRGSEIYRTELNTNFSTTFDIPSLYGKEKAGNFDLVNFRRGLASMNLNYLSYEEANWTAWDKDDPENKLFDANIMERYAANRFPVGSDPIITTALLNIKKESYPSSSAPEVTATPYAADPFLASLSNYRVNPFYTFYCLDNAFEIKARIRMVVREWDRVFPSNTANLELISDLGLNPPGTGNPDDQRRQDIPTDSSAYDLEEVDSDPGLYNTYNDIRDWDDLVPMQRSDTSSDSVQVLVGLGTFVLSPFPTATYTDGWWNPNYFPNQGSSN